MKMKKIIALSAAALSSLGWAYAGGFQASPHKVKIKQAALVTLYASQKGKKVTSTLPVNAPLVRIFQQGDWVKVGNPKDGSVGWVNKKQYQQALRAYYQPQIKTLYVSSSDDKAGKPEINVVAYKNGEKVSDKEAKAMYEKLRAQQKAQDAQWQRFNHRMMQFQRMMWRDMQSGPFMNQSLFLGE